jgi:hypothetical protein
LEKLMPSLDTAAIVLAGIALFAAFVNGAIGYGFSSLAVPLAIVFYTNRILNPAVVIIEVFLNLYVLFINLNGVPAVWKRVVFHSHRTVARHRSRRASVLACACIDRAAKYPLRPKRRFSLARITF